ncbi:DNA-binding transcriptional regulator GbsR, MarR family [Nonomuraea jiangxiensis]|uniref:DNA-binding transcriptional regulator GbsR, MarR family n=2 Tax=Nonomuraea jiangxiensis TaxID=633440 RepID=A0A1G7Z1N3_9ACTN|nr:DNA-binding transcriptional regulator GbsR, MarR family [Nonomuraea jiangxiensis]
MEPREAEFVDRMGLVMERFGGTRTMGRLYAWLMICDPPHQSLTDLAATLSVSKTAISTVARQMETAGMLERVPTPGREHHYRTVHGGWAQIMRVQFAHLRAGLEALDFGLEIVGDDRPEARARLRESREFFAFTEHDAELMLHRWEEYREKAEAEEGQAG